MYFDKCCYSKLAQTEKLIQIILTEAFKRCVLDDIKNYLIYDKFAHNLFNFSWFLDIHMIIMLVNMKETPSKS